MILSHEIGVRERISPVSGLYRKYLTIKIILRVWITWQSGHMAWQSDRREKKMTKVLTGKLHSQYDPSQRAWSPSFQCLSKRLPWSSWSQRQVVGIFKLVTGLGVLRLLCSKPNGNFPMAKLYWIEFPARGPTFQRLPMPPSYLWCSPSSALTLSLHLIWGTACKQNGTPGQGENTQ